MNRYIYIVNTLVKNAPDGISNIPNLGVHTSFKSAERHFDAVVSNRENYGSEIFWTKRYHDMMGLPGNGERVCLVKESYTKRGSEIETIRLEKWRLHV